MDDSVLFFSTTSNYIYTAIPTPSKTLAKNKSFGKIGLKDSRCCFVFGKRTINALWDGDMFRGLMYSPKPPIDMTKAQPLTT